MDRAIRLIGRKYAPDCTEERLEEAIAKEYPALAMIALDIEHVTGKESAGIRAEKRDRAKG